MATRLSWTLASLKELDAGIVADFNNLTKDDKAQFHAANHNLIGKDLAMQVCETVAFTKSVIESKKLIDHSKYEDEIDLKVAYANKPDQLKNILKNAPSMDCPIRKTKLYADPEYEVVNTQEELESRKRTVECRTSGPL